jgi:hypothetical protein
MSTSGLKYCTNEKRYRVFRDIYEMLIILNLETLLDARKEFGLEAATKCGF